MSRLSQYMDRGTAAGTDEVPIIQDAETVKTTAGAIANTFVANPWAPVVAVMQKSSSVQSVSINSTTGVQVNINTLEVDSDSIATLSNNVLTLPAGTYDVDGIWVIQGYTVNTTPPPVARISIYNKDLSTDLLWCHGSKNESTLSDNTNVMQGRIVLSSETDLEFRIYGSLTSSYSADIGGSWAHDGADTIQAMFWFFKVA